MESTTSSHEDLICQTCGDKGFTNAYIYCVKCLEFVIHRYCLRVMPKKFDEFVNWVCEDCQQPLPYPSISHKLNPKQNTTRSPQIKTMKRKKRSNIPKKKRKIARFLERKDDVIFQEKSQQHVSSPSNSPVKKHLQSKAFVLALEAQTKGDNIKKINESLKINENITRKMSDSIEHSGCDSSCTDVNLKNKPGINQEPVTSPEKFHSSQKAETANQMKSEQEKRGGDDATQSSGFENNNNVEYISYEHAQPVLDPIWRGSFDITQTDYNLFEGFVGHLSDKACYKVCQEANVLPSLLTLEMHPKSVLWPKSFLEFQPTDDNIALYFFPGDIKNERDYEELVSDMIDEELAMKAPTKNAELLIFTSRVLPQPFWRFQGKNYLWGVFRGNKSDNIAVSNNSSENPVLLESFPQSVTSGKEILTKVKTFDSQSPQSPLCSYR